MNSPKLELGITGDRVYCGRPGCFEPIGGVGPRGVYLPGKRWHARRIDDIVQWERAGRQRRMSWTPFEFDVIPNSTVPRPGDVVVCPNPKCKARQRVPVVIDDSRG